MIGWREYVWCLYWAQPGWRDRNGLGATRPLPPAFTTGETDMACLAAALRTVDEHAWTHHIPRLIVMGALGLMAGVEPQAMVGWMRERFVDAADWVMQPNVVGMALYADGGIMATKPYAAGGAYISKMSDHCRGCRYDPKARTGEDACPYTTLYTRTRWPGTTGWPGSSPPPGSGPTWSRSAPGPPRCSTPSTRVGSRRASP